MIKALCFVKWRSCVCPWSSAVFQIRLINYYFLLEGTKQNSLPLSKMDIEGSSVFILARLYEELLQSRQRRHCSNVKVFGYSFYESISLEVVDGSS